MQNPRLTVENILAGQSFVGEFLELFIGSVIGLALVGVILNFASTASVSAANAGQGNAATLFGLVGLFIAIVIVAAIAGVAYREVQKYRHGRIYTHSYNIGKPNSTPLLAKPIASGFRFSNNYSSPK